MNTFQHVQCRLNYFEIISDVVTREIKLFQRFISHVSTVLVLLDSEHRLQMREQLRTRNYTNVAYYLLPFNMA